jgi:hypothetical protein
MAADPSSPARRLGWHPLTVAGVLAVAALAAACAVSLAAGPVWLVLGVWLLMGTTSGFAVSGST